jgi:hypothetical protein
MHKVAYIGKRKRLFKYKKVGHSNGPTRVNDTVMVIIST